MIGTFNWSLKKGEIGHSPARGSILPSGIQVAWSPNSDDFSLIHPNFRNKYGWCHGKGCKSESHVPDFCKYLLISVGILWQKGLWRTSPSLGLWIPAAIPSLSCSIFRQVKSIDPWKSKIQYINFKLKPIKRIFVFKITEKFIVSLSSVVQTWTKAVKILIILKIQQSEVVTLVKLCICQPVIS